MYVRSLLFLILFVINDVSLGYLQHWESVTHIKILHLVVFALLWTQNFTRTLYWCRRRHLTVRMQPVACQ